MTNPIVPNFSSSSGARLATDRFDFNDHVNGDNFRHKASQIDLFPTVVIGSTKTNVQDAIAALASAIAPPVIPDATTSTKGIIKLSGDLSGTATSPSVIALRGFPISAATPHTGFILTYNGSSWTPSANTSAFTASGDLGGTNTFQQVNSLSGLPAPSGNIVSINNGSILSYASANPMALLTQDNNITDDGVDFTIRAQSSNITNKNGGNLILSSGKNGNGGLKGSIKLQLTTNIPNTYPSSVTGISTMNMLEISEVATNRRILSLCNSSDISSGDVPSGDMLIFVKNALAISTIAPTNGFLLFSNGGNPYFHTSGNIRIGITGTATTATSGGLGILPPHISGYLTMDIDGTTYKIPYYAN